MYHLQIETDGDFHIKYGGVYYYDEISMEVESFEQLLLIRSCLHGNDYEDVSGWLWTIIEGKLTSFSIKHTLGATTKQTVTWDKMVCTSDEDQELLAENVTSLEQCIKEFRHVGDTMHTINARLENLQRRL